MSKKILINLSFSIWPMLGYELDFIQQKLDEGHLVKILYCDGSPDFCSANNLKSFSNKKLKLVCNYCKLKFTKGLEWLNNYKNLIIENFETLDFFQKEKILDYDYLLKKKVVDEQILKFLKEINYHLEDIIKTTMISETDSVNLNFKEKKNFTLFKKISRQTIVSFYSSLNHLEKFNPDEIYVFNGRIYRYQPMLRLAKFRKEFNYVNTYEFPLYGFQNMMIVKNHHFAEFKNLSDELFNFNKTNNINFFKKEIVVKDWIKNREVGKNYKIDWYPWKKKQICGKLPEKFDKKKINFTYFTSSETEFFGIPENERDFKFVNNIEIVKAILEYIKDNLNISLTVRMHPLINNDTKINLKKITNLKKQYPGLIIVEPQSEVDSYELIKNSNLILVTGSTVGVEAAYFKKNVISLSNSPYMNFGATKRVFNFEELKVQLNKCINNNYEDFPNDIKKYEGAVNFIYSIYNFNFKSKFLIKKNFKNEHMIKKNIIYSLAPNGPIKYFYKIYCLIRFFFKKLKIYI
jgi:hypothetical protein